MSTVCTLGNKESIYSAWDYLHFFGGKVHVHGSTLGAAGRSMERSARKATKQYGVACTVGKGVNFAAELSPNELMAASRI
jgi:hypothetical protein